MAADPAERFQWVVERDAVQRLGRFDRIGFASQSIRADAGAGADLLAFIDAAAGHDPGVPIFMMAHSLGGTAALNMALDFPDRAARLRGLVLEQCGEALLELRTVLTPAQLEVVWERCLGGSGSSSACAPACGE